MAKSAAVVGGGNGAINFEASFESWSSQQKPRFTKRVSPAAASAAAESSSTSGGGGSPFVVDIGSWRTRAGFACSPVPVFDFPSIRLKESQSVTVGYGGTDTPYDAQGLVQLDVVENIMDSLLLHLDLRHNASAPPLLLTEPLCNPLSCRKLMSELCFEAYNTPRLAFGIDSLFSYYYNHLLSISSASSSSSSPLSMSWQQRLDQVKLPDALLLSSSHNYTTGILVKDGIPFFDSCKRLAWGGLPAAEYMLKLLGMKYPNFPHKVTIDEAEMMVSNYCHVSNSYIDDLTHMASGLDAIKEHSLILHYPAVDESLFGGADGSAVDSTKTAEELEAIDAKRKEQGRRLQEQVEKQRMEKLKEKQELLEEIGQALELRESDPEEFLERLQDLGYSTLDALLAEQKKLDLDVRRALDKAQGGDGILEKEIPDFSLVSVPDSELNDAQKKEKKKQRLLKASHDARERMRQEKEAERLKKELEDQKDEEWRLNDFQGWVANLRQKHSSLKSKIDSRKKLREDLKNRKSHAAQMRMKNIAALVVNDDTGVKGGSRKKRKRNKTEDDDDFGMDDDDWGVYRDIKDEDDSSDERDQTEYTRLTDMLLHHDRTFEEAGSNDAGASTWDRLKSGGYRKREARPGDPETNIPREEEIVVDDEALMQELTSEAVVLAKAAAARAAASGGTITATAATSGQAAVPIIGVVGGGNAVVPPLPSSGSLLVVATGQNLQQAQQVSISPMKFKMRREERMIQEKRRLLDTIDKQEAQRDAYRLYLNVERIRVSECLFRPEIVGLDGQGVGEWIESFQCPTVFLTGGNTQYRGIVDRVSSILESSLASGTSMSVQMAKSPTLDAWKGAAAWGNACMKAQYKGSGGTGWITRAQYDEFGGHYIAEHFASNKWLGRGLGL